MKTLQEMEINISNGRIINAKLISDTKLKLTIDLSYENYAYPFTLIEASKLSVNDEFMHFNPETEDQDYFKTVLTQVLQKGIKDFYKSNMDPSYTIYKTFYFSENSKPATKLSLSTIKDKVKTYNFKKGSRLGTTDEYIVFLGYLIKQLHLYGNYSLSKAWNAVITDSSELGNFTTLLGEKNNIEKTNSRSILGFSDLGNTFKVLSDSNDPEKYWIAGGDYTNHGFYTPLFHMFPLTNKKLLKEINAVPWIVMEK